MLNKLKYTHYVVTFQEVPDEISLVFNVSGCPHHCEGCHSQYLSEYIGDYISDDIDLVLKKYDKLISCVCFMGGDQNVDELHSLLAKVKKYGLKTCLYSGESDINKVNSLFDVLDYLKIGPYIKELGGLDSSKTNQRFYIVSNNNLTDITYRFWR